jgi:type IV pilus assembly protein PilZ
MLSSELHALHRIVRAGRAGDQDRRAPKGSRSIVQELRRFARASLNVSVHFSPKGSAQKVEGFSKDISLGGMFIDTGAPLAHNAELTVYLQLPGQSAIFELPAVVRWTSATGMGVQFGNLGARETYAITEVTKQAAGA